MKLLLLLFAFGVIFLLGSMIVMWYLFVLGFMLLIVMVILSYWLTFMLVDDLTDNVDLAQFIGICVAILAFVCIIILAYRWGEKIQSQT